MEEELLIKLGGGETNRVIVLALLVTLLMPFIVEIPLVLASPAKWTFMVYLDADNNLDPAGVDDILEMQAIGSTSDVNIVVLFDRYDRVCGFNGSAVLYVYKGWNETIWGGWTSDYELNMGDPATLTWFIGFASEHYPAEKYALILWDHGSNWEGVCWDWTNNDYLTIQEVREALDNSQVKINLLAFDACLMASIEVSYEISLTNKVDVMVASEDFIQLDGYPYDMILKNLTENPLLCEDTFAVHIIDDYILSYTHTACFATLSAINLKYVSDLTDHLKALCNELMLNFVSYKHAVTGAKNRADRYWFGFWHQGPYIDLHQFTYQLGVIEKNLKPYTDPILQTWNNAVIYARCCNGPHIQDGAGLTIYFPRNL